MFVPYPDPGSQTSGIFGGEIPLFLFGISSRISDADLTTATKEKLVTDLFLQEAWDRSIGTLGLFLRAFQVQV